VLVRLEDEEFRALVKQAQGAVDSAAALMKELETGSRPEEIQKAQHNLEEARAALANNKITLDRTRDLVSQGALSRQAMDDATARFEASQQRLRALEQSY